jgi:cytidylate kinase
MVAENNGFDKNYVANLSENDAGVFYASTIGRGFNMPSQMMMQSAQITAAEHDIIRELSEEGDCVIVGRCADVILEKKSPFRIFVYADDKSKIARCRERAKDSEAQLSDKALLRKIRSIDKRRRSYRAMFSDKLWGKASSYDLCINTSGKDIKDVVEGVVAYIDKIYGGEK